MSPLSYYLIILVLVLLLLFFITLGAVYQYRTNLCVFNPSPVCFNDWTCENDGTNLDCSSLLSDKCETNTAHDCYVKYCQCLHPNKPALQLDCILQGCKTILVDNINNPCDTPGPNCTPGVNLKTCRNPLENLPDNNN